MSWMSRVVAGGLLAALAAAAPAAAQSGPGNLAGIRQMQVAAGINADAPVREACGVTDAALDQLFNRFRGPLAEAGLQLPANAVQQTVSPRTRVQAGTAVEQTAPAAILAASVVGIRTPAGDLVCAVSFTAWVERTVFGTRLAPNGPAADRRVHVWTDDGLNIAPPSEIGPRALAAAEQIGRQLAQSWRRDNP